MTLGPFYTLFLVFAAIALLVFAYSLFSSQERNKKPVKATRRQGTIGEAGVCPVCGTVLTVGEQIKSALFPGEKDRLCHIFGCPHCHPYPMDDVERRCPVCKKKVPLEGYLVARLFERPQKKRHVHILGCTVCRFPKKK